MIGTVQGDLHDIGKNLVGMMFKGAGFEVCDMGVDVGADAFIDKAEEIGADVIGMSALLSTTMPQMQECIRRLEERGLREKYIVMIGGAPVTDDFAKEIGADYYTPDAASAAETARNAVGLNRPLFWDSAIQRAFCAGRMNSPHRRPCILSARWATR